VRWTVTTVRRSRVCSTVLNQRAGSLSWDYRILDENAMARDPFYAEFLTRVGLRYFMSAVAAQPSR
jgi:hypothetical protein